jgi:N-methylhydantoinase B
VLEDVLGGFVTAAAAQTFYGVAIRDGALDVEATAKLRADRPAVKPFHRNIYLDELA